MARRRKYDPQAAGMIQIRTVQDDAISFKPIVPTKRERSEVRKRMDSWRRSSPEVARQAIENIMAMLDHDTDQQLCDAWPYRFRMSGRWSYYTKHGGSYLWTESYDTCEQAYRAACDGLFTRVL